jgi:CubicO group peptidase (beta-lactamase class C family)
VVRGRDGPRHRFAGPGAPAGVVLVRDAEPGPGLVCATAADAAAFARLHLDDGRAPDGTRVLAASTVAEMQHPQVAVPNPIPMASHWVLGWALSDWGGRRVVGHDGDTIGQSAFLRVAPDAGVAVVLLTNSDRTGAFYREVFSELLAELCDLTMPPPLEPPATPPEVDLRRRVGVYERGMVGQIATRGVPTAGRAAPVAAHDRRRAEGLSGLLDLWFAVWGGPWSATW